MKKSKLKVEKVGEVTQVQLLPSVEGEEMHVLGELYGTTLVTVRDPSKNLMRRWNAYGFNAELIDSEMIDVIVILLPHPQKRKMVTVEDIRTFGQIQHVEGFEPQYFIGVEHLTDAE